ncbi:uncharacterized protein LOC143041467 [Oratosquilla oratoria]|uniref:uncharacterized protein LOC143041467 n=1 Tax=Oratosquilla oratoria TaxID=337810 RepID=UPI003F77524D
MGSHRLFVGGINPTVSQEKFESFIRKQVNVDNFTLKEKKDPEGVVLSKFAHINVFANPRELSDYVWSLNGKVWKGSKLRVEVAKESFMERLQREREEAARDKKNSQKSATTEGTDLSSADIRGKPFVSSSHEQMQKKSVISEKLASPKKRKKTDITRTEFQEDSIQSEKKQGVPVFKGISQVTNGTGDDKEDRLSSDESSDLDHGVLQPKKKRLKNGGRKEEDQMLQSFKKFSSVWADSDAEEEDNEDDEDLEETKRRPQEIHDTNAEGMNEDVDSCAGGFYNAEESVRDECNNQLEILSSILGTQKPIQLSQNRRPTQMTRYDPTVADHQKYEVNEVKRKSKEEKKQDEKKISQDSQDCPTKTEKKKPSVMVSETLNFKEKSEGFSLLAQFAQKREEEGKELEVRKEVPTQEIVSVSKPRIKTSNFFVDPSGQFIKDAVSWMVQPQTEEYLQSFAEVQPQLRELYKTRVARVLRSTKATRGKLARGRGRSRGSGNSQSRGVSRKTEEGGRGGRGGNQRSKS